MYRNLAPDEGDIADPAVIFPTPEVRGALVLAASQEFESAAECDFNDGCHGVLTHALLRVLRESPVTESADRLFLSVRASMKSDEFIQEPVLSGTAERREETIFGGKATDLSGKLTIAVLKVLDDGSLDLQGGIAVGVRENCELKKIDAQAGAQIRIKITETLGITRCKGKVIEGDLRNISPGDLFEMDRYAFSNDALLRIWMPPPLGFRKDSRNSKNDVKSENLR